METEKKYIYIEREKQKLKITSTKADKFENQEKKKRQTKNIGSEFWPSWNFINFFHRCYACVCLPCNTPRNRHCTTPTWMKEEKNKPTTILKCHIKSWKVVLFSNSFISTYQTTATKSKTMTYSFIPSMEEKTITATTITKK